MRNQNISLLGLLAIVACAAIGVSHAITSFRLSRVNNELATLRQRLELIPVADPDFIAARRLPSTDENIHRWAVRLPNTNSKVLYANWGSSPTSDLQDIKAKSARIFQLAPDLATREAMIRFTVSRNPNDPQWGSLKIESGDVSIIAIGPEVTSLLMGDTPCRSEAIGDNATTRPASSPITLFAAESSSNPKTAFCLWIDQPPPPDGG